LPSIDDYTPPFTITESMLQHIAIISEKLGKVNIDEGLKKKPHLRKISRIKSVYASCRIEANSLTQEQVKAVIDGQMVFGDAKDIKEVQNAYAAYASLENINPYSMADLQKMHRLMTENLLNESGQFRHGEEGVFSGDKCIFMAPPARFVPHLMEQLFSWMNRERNKLHPLIMAAVFHYEFVFIHPYADGNGRIARLWHTALLYNWKNVFAYLPLESQIEKFQDEYYAAIAKCHREASSNSFIEFMLERIEITLDEINVQFQQDVNMASEYVQRLLQAMESGIPYTATALMAMLNLKSRSSFRKAYLQPALNSGFISMTIPDKPNSRNQRYVKL